METAQPSLRLTSGGPTTRRTTYGGAMPPHPTLLHDAGSSAASPRAPRASLARELPDPADERNECQGQNSKQSHHEDSPHRPVDGRFWMVRHLEHPPDERDQEQRQEHKDDALRHAGHQASKVEQIAERSWPGHPSNFVTVIARPMHTETTRPRDGTTAPAPLWGV